MNYTKLVETFRELARDLLRLRWINNIKDQILDLTKRIAREAEQKQMTEKNIMRAEFQISTVLDTDPDKETKLEAQKASIEYAKENIKNIEERITNLEADITKCNETIAKVESGELKVDSENLSTKAKELVEVYVKEQAKNVIVE
jgi:chromosome segregation ATPase